MTLSMYEASVPNFLRSLDNLSKILSKAEAWAEAKKIDPSVLVNARLAPDMFPLSRQIQITSDSIKGCVARLAGIDIPSFPDTETTFADLQERIAKTVKFAQGVSADQINGSEDKKISFKGGSTERNFNGRDYLFTFVLPNVHFHTTVAYAILRHNGLDIGKGDYLGKVG